MADTPTQAGGLKSVLTQRHPLYNEFAADWEFFLASYVGGTNYTGAPYLFSHDREAPERFSKRQTRAVFNNYSRKVIDIYASFLYRQDIERASKDETLQLFLDDADLRGHSFGQVMADTVSRLSFAMGHTVVIVDLNKREEGAAPSRAAERELGVRPYISVYTPTNVHDWGLNPDGSYRWIRVEEPAPDESDPFRERGEPACRYRTWTETEWRLHDEDGNQIGGGPNPLGRVPAERIAPLEHPVQREVGWSIISDIAPLNRAIYNYRSLLDEFLFLQCFNIVAIPIPGDPKAVDTVKKLMSSLGSSTGIYFDPSKGGAPVYVTPPIDPADFLLRMIEASSKEIIDLAKLQDRSASAKAESGMARAYEFIEANAVFSSIARHLQDAERRILHLVELWGNPKAKIADLPVTLSYPDDFNAVDLNEEIDQALSLLTMQISPTYAQEVKKGIVRKTLPGADQETLDQIEDEIEAGSDADSAVRERATLTKQLDDETDPEEHAPPVTPNADATKPPPAQPGGAPVPA